MFRDECVGGGVFDEGEVFFVRDRGVVRPVRN